MHQNNGYRNILGPEEEVSPTVDHTDPTPGSGYVANRARHAKHQAMLAYHAAVADQKLADGLHAALLRRTIFGTDTVDDILRRLSQV